MRASVRLLLLALLFSLLPVAAEAQYFGRNKVQWESFDFKVLQTEHFEIYYYDQEADVVEDIGRMAERWYARLSRVFNHSFNRKPIVLYANAADFHQTTTTGGLIGEGTGGFTDAFMNRVVLPLTGDYAENDHVLGHEIVHVFQYDIAAKTSQNRRRFALEQMPLWLVEGMAEYFSKGRIDPLTSMWIRDATIQNRLPDLQKLNRDPRYFPYRYGQALMAYIGARFGDEAVVRYFMAAGMIGVDQAFERAVGIPHKQLFADWHEAARELYNPVIQSRPSATSTPLIGKKPIIDPKGKRRGGGELNVGPALSPDGRYIAFLSARDLFSIDLYLADAKTGAVIRQLVSENRDAHFESLRFIESAGSWSPDGRRLAFITFARGDNFLSIVDVETRRTEHLHVDGIEAISSVAWSPDGKTIAIGGQSTGVSDLFLYDLESKNVHRLTNDKFADLQPAWSPDGRTLAFVTDRGAGSTLEQLQFREMHLATIDIATAEIRNLDIFRGVKHINPQWSADGGSIYFIANNEGIPDIYRYNVRDGATSRVTAVQTGVAGITDMSPALTVASRSGDIAYSLYEGDNYNIYGLPAGPATTGVNTAQPDGIARAAILPPLRAAGSEITAYLARPEEGLPPEDANFKRSDYSPHLRLSYLGPPSLGVGVGEFGFAAGGSLTAYFSDVLGQHNVGVTFQGGGYSSGGALGIEDQIGGEVFYLNQKHRVNWGADLVHFPYTAVGTRYGTEVIDIEGTPVLADIYEQLYETQTITDAQALVQYPFSSTRRIEAAGGYRRYNYKVAVERYIFIGNQLYDRDTDELPFGYTLNLYQASTAFVGDSAIYGFISPVRGTRYRNEITALRGDLNFETALIDYRRYFFARPVTFAMRGVHYGRYGQDAENNLLSLLNIGDGNLVRGYDPISINPIECVPVPGQNNCPIFDRLQGSKIAAASFEVRAPLFGTQDYGLINAPFLPTEIFGFADVGAAWIKGETPEIKWETDSSERIPVASAGLGLRILLAYIPIEVYVAKPFQRPTEDVVYGFNIVPGW